MKNSGLMAFLIGALALLIGCRSNLYFQDRAVGKAREFVLENVRDLTPEQVYYIKFNDPVLLHAPILGKRGYSAEKEHLTSETEQICVYFQVPGVEKGFLVYGVSDQRMYNWKPIRLIRKNFVSRQYFIEPAIGTARTYAQNSLYPQLSARDFNHIRFMPPALLETTFVFNFNPGNKLEPAAEKALRQAAAKGQQLSLVWHLPESGKYAVFTGYSTAPLKIEGWVLNIADIYSENDLIPATVAVFKCPGTVVKEAPRGVKVVELPQIKAVPVVKFPTNAAANPQEKDVKTSPEASATTEKVDIPESTADESPEKADKPVAPSDEKMTAESDSSSVKVTDSKSEKSKPDPDAVAKRDSTKPENSADTAPGTEKAKPEQSSKVDSAQTESKPGNNFDADDLTRSYEEQTQNAAPQAQKDK